MTINADHGSIYKMTRGVEREIGASEGNRTPDLQIHNLIFVFFRHCAGLRVSEKYSTIPSPSDALVFFTIAHHCA